MLKMSGSTYRQELRQRQHYLSWNAHFEWFAVSKESTEILTNKDQEKVKACHFVQDYRARLGNQSSPCNSFMRKSFILYSGGPRRFSGNST